LPPHCASAKPLAVADRLPQSNTYAKLLRLDSRVDRAHHDRQWTGHYTAWRMRSVEASNPLREPVFDRREIRWRESLERLDLRVAADLRLEHGVVRPWNHDQG